MAEAVARPHPPFFVAGRCCDEIEVFMMVRHHEIDFNSGALVFPGGSVDASDKEIIARPELFSGGEGLDAADVEFPHRRRSRDLRGKRHPAGAAAGIERRWSMRSAPPKSKPAIARRLCEGKTTFPKVLTDNKMSLALDLLVPYAHWITPEGMPKRFDTWFFLASAPPAQVGAHDGKESTELDLGVAARGARGWRERAVQAAFPDHAQFDPARQAAQRQARRSTR